MMRPLIIDNFAGGGGASTGLEAAFGRSVDVAINHDEAAVAVHTANHPSTTHYCQSIYSVDPLEATGGEPVLLAWFSPDCKHHSKAKGGKPREKYIRDMAWVVPHWIERLGDWDGRKLRRPERAPQVIMLENVEEFRQWGPLDDEGRPIKERQGEEFQLWVRRIRRLGYKVEWRELRACDYGAPTSRKRLFLIARRDGLPIVWPEPTHGRPDSVEVRTGKLSPWRTAAECIDWSIECPSIFDRSRPLKDATCRRIAAGVMRYVVNAAKPFIIGTAFVNTRASRVFDPDEPLRTATAQPEYAVVSPGIVPITHSGGDRVHDAAEPLRTVTTARRGELAATAASLIKLRNNSHGEDPAAPLGAVTSGGQHHGVASATLIGVGGRRGQSPPLPVDVPHPTMTAKADGAIVSAFLTQYYGEKDNGQVRASAALNDPARTATSGGNRFGLVCAHLEQANGGGVIGHDAREPVSTITITGSQQRVVETTLVEADALPPDMMERAVAVAAFLVKYYGTGGENEGSQIQRADRPIDTITAKPRFAVVTVTIDAVTFVLVDIGMRMLTPRELANAQGFPADYKLDPVCWYRTDNGNRKYGPLPKSHQIAKIGNSVCPPMSEALARVNFPDWCIERQAA